MPQKNPSFYKRHVRGKSPISYLPPILQTGEAWKELEQVIPLKLDVKASTANIFYVFITKADAFNVPLLMNHRCYPKQPVDASTKAIDKIHVVEITRSRHQFWQHYLATLATPSISISIFNKIALYNGYTFAENFVFVIPEELKVAVFGGQIAAAKKIIEDLQKKFMTQINVFKETTLQHMLNDILQLPLSTDLKQFLITGIPKSKCKDWLSHALAKTDTQDDVQLPLSNMLKSVTTYIEVNRSLIELHEELSNTEKLLAPCRMRSS